MQFKNTITIIHVHVHTQYMQWPVCINYTTFRVSFRGGGAGGQGGIFLPLGELLPPPLDFRKVNTLMCVHYLECRL